MDSRIAIWSTPDGRYFCTYGVLHLALYFYNLEYSRCQNYRAIWSATLQHLKHSIGLIFLPHGALSDLLQKSVHLYIPHPMEYSISTYFCAIWSTPECLDLYARWSSKMIKKATLLDQKHLPNGVLQSVKICLLDGVLKS